METPPTKMELEEEGGGRCFHGNVIANTLINILLDVLRT